MLAVVWIGQDHVEADGEDGSHHKHLEHEVVEGGDEELEPGLCFERWSIIVSKLFSSLWKIRACEAHLQIDLEPLSDAFHACTGVSSGSGHLPPYSLMRVISSSKVRSW